MKTAIQITTFGLLAFVALRLCVSCTGITEDERQLTCALEQGNTNFLHQYFRNNSNVNQYITYPSTTRDTAPLLDIAAKSASISSVLFLLERGANPNLIDSAGRTTLIWAIWKADGPVEDSTRIVEMLLKHGADPNMKATDSYYYSPMHYAAWSGKTKCVQLLIEYGATVSPTNSLGRIPLHYASTVETAKLLLQNGADPSTRDANGETPVDTASRDRILDVVNLLQGWKSGTNAVGAAINP